MANKMEWQYVHCRLESNVVVKMSFKKYELVLSIQAMNTKNIVTNRPSKSEFKEFGMKLTKIMLKNLKESEPIIIWTGGFNFQFTEWEEEQIMGVDSNTRQ